ncbi:MAG TPA: CotH kinase family protein, partial [Polyangia bacterium]|nr:CotH kinase family protein [Polyangia bacterium]
LLGLVACHKKGTIEDAPVVISEIMYHAVLDDGPSETHEFIELQSRRAQEQDLGGWQLKGGIRFKFPAGTRLAPNGFLVVAKDKARLVADVPSYQLDAGAVLGDYDGELDNGGERITLADAAGDTVDDVAYDDAFPWPVSADALGAGEDWLPPEMLPLEKHRFMGRSLERVSPDLPGSRATNWLPSPLDGATPGRANTVRGEPPALVATLSIVPERSGALVVRPGDGALVRATFSKPVAAPQVELFVDDVERDDEPHQTVPFEKEGDGFSARLPAQAAGSIVRYRVIADRGRGSEPLAPRAGDPNGWFGYFVAPDITGQTPVYQLFVRQADWNQLWDNIAPGRIPGNGNGTNPAACAVNDLWNGRVPAVLAVDGRVFDVAVRYEGSFQGRLGGANIDPKKWPVGASKPDRPNPFRALSWSIKFPRYRKLDGVKSFNLNKLTQSCQGFNTVVGNALFEQAGIPAAQASWVRLYLNGTYYHYMLRMEHMDEDFIKRAYGKGTPGDLFKSVGGRWDEGPYGYSDERPLQEYCGYTIDQRYQANYDRSTNEDWKSGGAEVRKLIEDLAAARAAGLPAMRKFFADNFDLPALTTYIAVINWMVAWDDQYHNHYLYLRPDGRWIMLPTDMDNVMGGAPPSLSDASFFTGQYNVRSNRNDYWSYLKDAFLRAYRQEFMARVVELDQTVLAPEQVSALVDQL